MASEDSIVVQARRARLRQWINANHDGKQADFQKATKINQGLLSGLLGGTKSFGEKQAKKLEEAAGMPAGFLVQPLDSPGQRRLFTPGSTEPTDIEGKLLRYEADIFNLRAVLNAVLASLAARSTPAEAAELHAALRALPGQTHGYLAEAIETVREAREMTAKEQLSALRLLASSGGGKT